MKTSTFEPRLRNALQIIRHIENTEICYRRSGIPLAVTSHLGTSLILIYPCFFFAFAPERLRLYRKGKNYK